MAHPAPEKLLEQLHWLRALARRLARDPHLADDAVQDTVVAALSSKACRPSSLRAWLGTALRNALAQRGRADSRRAKREEEVARTREGLAPPSVDSVSELSVYRRLLELVEALEEPCRTVITRRFLRGETPAEIARALGVPRQTVYSRIERGLRRLRRQLDDTVSGGRQIWCAAFLMARGARPPAPPIGTGITLAKGVTLMKTALVAAVILVASLLVVWRSSLGGIEAPAPKAQDGPAVAEAVEIEVVPVERQSVGTAAPSDLAEAPASPVLLTGSVVDLDGHPVPDLQVVFERSEGPDTALDPDVEPVRSDNLGNFQLPLPESRGRLRVVDPEWATARHPWLDGAVPSVPTIVVVAPMRGYSGRVVDENGLPVAGARVDLDLPDAWGHELEAMGLVVALPETLGFTHSDESGAFRFASVPFVEGTAVVALRDNYEPDSLPLPASSREDLVLTLRPVSATGLHGIVLDALDRPVAGALVSSGRTAVETGPEGRFIVDPPYMANGSIWALKPGYGAASLWIGGGSSSDLVLRLPGEPLAIRGVLVDGDGTPVPGATVWTPDTTYFGEVLELDLGTPVRGMNSIEGLLSGVPAPARILKTTTGADGGFELTGLTPRRYALFALVERGMATAGPVDAEPGTGAVRLELSAGTPRPIAGRVLSRSGTPLAGIRIRLGRSVPWERPVRPIDPWASSPTVPPGATLTATETSAITDEDGRFSIPAVHTDGTFLTFRGEAMFPSEPFQLSESTGLGSIEARVDARSTFRLLVADPGGADAFHLEGADGHKQPLFMQVEQLTMSAWSIPLVDGRSGIGYSLEGEVTVVLTRQDEEVRRYRVFLPAGGLHELAL